MTIKIKTASLRRILRIEYILSMLILLPYVEGGALLKALRIYLNATTYIPAIISMMAITWGIVILLIGTYRPTKIKINFYIAVLMFLIFYAMFWIIIADDLVNSFSVWLWFSFPIIVSLTVRWYCKLKQLDYSKIIKGMIYLFCIYSVILIVYNIAQYGLFTDVSYRMNSRAGGAVIYGYTVAVMFALCVCYKKHFSLRNYYVILAMFTLSSIATGSRGSVWPVMLLWVLNFLFEKVTPKRVIAGSVIASVLIVMSFLFEGMLVDVSTSDLALISRLFDTDGGIRTISLQSAFDLLKEQKMRYSIFGHGIGQFFPYQAWVIGGGIMAQNRFLYAGRLFLVQPHNSFVYLLIELGLVGLVLACSFFIGEIVTFIKNRRSDSRSIFRIVFVLSVIFVNMFDSVFFVQPGIAMIYWLLLLFVYEDHKRMVDNVQGDK